MGHKPIAFPKIIMFLHADAAGPITSGEGRYLVRKEHPMLNIMTSGNMPEGRRAIKPAVYFQFPMPAKLSFLFGKILLSIFSE